jgi:hypothetical protein
MRKTARLILFFGTAVVITVASVAAITLRNSQRQDEFLNDDAALLHIAEQALRYSEATKDTENYSRLKGALVELTESRVVDGPTEQAWKKVKVEVEDLVEDVHREAEKSISLLRRGVPMASLPPQEIEVFPSANTSAEASKLAQSFAKQLRALPAKYNRPDTLYLGSSIPIEFVIQTDPLQHIPGLLEGFPGGIKDVIVSIGNSASAYLTASKDMVDITLREGGQPRSVTTAAPVSWIWDVRPLRPGTALVVLEVFSHVNTGIEQGSASAQVRVLQDTWTIEAKGLEWLKWQIAQLEPIRAFLFALGSVIAGILAFFGIRELKVTKQRSVET